MIRKFWLSGSVALMFLLGTLFLAVFAAQGLRKTRTGRLLIAMRENERAAQSFTINLVRTRLAAFAVARWGRALVAWPALSVVATQVVPIMAR